MSGSEDDGGTGDVEHDALEARLDQALADYIEQREDDPSLVPGRFADRLPADLRAPFLRELEDLAEIDRLASAPPRDLPHRFGDFRILGRLGDGGSGVVYEAERIGDGRRVALKVLRETYAGDLRTIARFEREARTAASLVHPRIVPILDFGSQDGTAYLVMGLLEGRSVFRLLHADANPLDVDHTAARAFLDDPARLAAAFADVADALEFAHRRNVVHRDIKPANLMVGADGISILDFGLATTRGEESSLTRTGDFLGTPAYMPPEQVAGEELDARADLYALGSVLYECLSGQRPVTGSSLPDMLDRIRTVEVENPRKLVPEIPADLANIVMRCLEKERGRRYPSAAALADDLRRFATGETVRAGSVGPGGRLIRRVRRHPTGYVVGAVVTAVVCCALAFAAWKESESRRARIDRELREIPTALAQAPEGITVFGGASRRFFETFGMGGHLPEPERGVSPAGREVLRRARELVVEAPSDPRAHRLLVRVLMDLGDDPEAARAACRRLLAVGGGVPRDRALAGVLALLAGDEAEADQVFAQLLEEEGGADGSVQFFRGLYHQLHHRYWEAIDAFSAALSDESLSEDQRYFSFLHRGWCSTCPQVGRVRRAEDDLLRAATLRRNFGTPRLLRAGLRCLDASDAALSEAVETVQDVLSVEGVQPWTVVLTARVLLEFAESSSRLAGPVRFSCGVAPLVALPVEEGRRCALAQTALALLDGVCASAPDLVEPRVHRIGALVMLGRDGEALAASRALPDVRLSTLLEGRVHLAAGRASAASQALDRLVERDPSFAAGHLLRADVAEHVGDARGVIDALFETAAHLPASSTALPHIQTRIVETALAIGDAPLALETVESKRFGNALAGTVGSRVRAERTVLRVLALHALGSTPERLVAELDAARRRLDEIAPQPDNPLRALFSRLVPVARALGEKGAVDAMLESARLAVQGDWWRVLVLRRRGWLDLSPEAERELLAAIVARGGEPHGRVVEALARCEREIGLATEAVAHLTSVPASARTPNALAELAGLHSEVGDADASGRDLDALVADAGLAGVLPLLRETLLGDLSRPDLERVATIAEACGAQSGNDAARVLAAAVSWRTGDDAQLQGLFDEVLLATATDPRLRYLLARAALERGETRRARSLLLDEPPLSAGDLRYVESAMGVPAAHSASADLTVVLR